MQQMFFLVLIWYSSHSINILIERRTLLPNFLFSCTSEMTLGYRTVTAKHHTDFRLCQCSGMNSAVILRLKINLVIVFWIVLFNFFSLDYRWIHRIVHTSTEGLTLWILLSFLQVLWLSISAAPCLKKIISHW